MNDIVVLICGVILLLALLPMFLMRSAFKGAATKGKGAGEASLVVPVGAPPAKAVHDRQNGDSSPDGGDGGGGGK